MHSSTNLLSLPAEVRLSIYSHVFADAQHKIDTPSEQTPTKTTNPTTPAVQFNFLSSEALCILTTCKQIYIEAVQIYYQQCQFECDVTALTKFCDYITSCTSLPDDRSPAAALSAAPSASQTFAKLATSLKLNLRGASAHAQIMAYPFISESESATTPFPALKTVTFGTAKTTGPPLSLFNEQERQHILGYKVFHHVSAKEPFYKYLTEWSAAAAHTGEKDAEPTSDTPSEVMRMPTTQQAIRQVKVQLELMYQYTETSGAPKTKTSNFLYDYNRGSFSPAQIAQVV